MEKNKYQFPSEEVSLPSKGLLYPENSPLKKGVVEMKYMTAKEEDILTNTNLIENGTVIDKLLQSLIISEIKFNDLLVGDKNAILIASRILGYGSDYTFSYNNEQINVSLSDIKDKVIDESLFKDGKNEFDYILPRSKTPITFKFLTHGDEQKIRQEVKGLQKINKNSSAELSTRMKHIVTSVEGNSDQKFIREFVDNRFLAIDARELRQHIKKIQPDVDLTYNYEDGKGNTKEILIPVGINFFWPDASV